MAESAARDAMQTSRLVDGRDQAHSTVEGGLADHQGKLG